MFCVWLFFRVLYFLIGRFCIRRYFPQGHLGFEIPWRFAVAFKEFDTRALWFRNEALMSIEIQRRIVPTADGLSSLIIFDGAVQQSIMYPPPISEIIFCRDSITPWECVPSGHGFDPNLPNFPTDAVLEVKKLEHGEMHVFAKTNVSFPSYVGLEELVQSINFPPSTHELFMMMGTRHDLWARRSAFAFMNEQYFYISSHPGNMEAKIPSTILFFVNHGCFGSSNFGKTLALSENEADPRSIADEMVNMYIGSDRVYNPAANRKAFFHHLAQPLRTIEEGEEILVNKLAFKGLKYEGWNAGVVALQKKCATRI